MRRVGQFREHDVKQNPPPRHSLRSWRPSPALRGGRDKREPYRFALATGSVAVQVINSVQARAASAISEVLSSVPGAAVS